jgi:ATP-dependent RNA helicase DeaD
LKFDALKMIILDEADRMLDMGFRDDIERILSSTPPGRQTLFFSATMPQGIQSLIKRYSRDPAWIKIEAQAHNAPQVDQVYYEVDRRSKVEVLTRLIDINDFRYGLIFCSTKVMVDELDEHLHSRGYATDRLHGDLSQMQRTRVMEKFRRRGFEFLIATDVAARGLDVDDLEVVFNFDLPNDAEDYTHRIGRTGRAGKSGRALTFVSGREIYRLQSMVRFAKLKIRRESVPSMDQVEDARANVFFEKLRSILEAGAYEKQDRMVDRLLEQGFASTDICSALIQMLSGAGSPPPAAGQAAPKPVAGQLPAATTPPSAGKLSPASRPLPIGKAPAIKEPTDRAETPRSPLPQPPKARMESKFVQTPSPAAPELLSEAEEMEEEAPARTGKEAGMTTLFFNAGRKHLVTAEELVGKIAGVTRLPAQVIGAIDIRQRHSLVDVASEHAEFIARKLTGIRIRGHSLRPTSAKTGVGEGSV